jgi:hypothetical protein
MTAENGWWAETGDYLACADGLAAALDVFDTGGPALDLCQAATAATVRRYNCAQLETTLIAFWRDQLARLDLPKECETFSVALPVQRPPLRDWVPPVALRAASKLRRRWGFARPSLGLG